MLYNRGEQKLASDPDNTFKFAHGSVIRFQQKNTVFWSLMRCILAEAYHFYQTAPCYIPEDIITHDVISHK
jgi:predicted nucleotide-binding protein (sugar kinase/HSP70/actin superfamily)